MTPDRTDWSLVALLILGGIVAAMQVGKVPPLITTLQAELGIGMVASGWLASTIQATGAVAGLICGSLADRIGRRRALLGACALSALAAAGGALAESGTALLVSRVFESIGFVFIIVSIPALIVAASAPRDLRLSVGFWSIYLPTGAAIAMIATPLLAPVTGWQAIWWAGAVLLAAYGIALAFAFRARPMSAASRGAGRLDLRDFLAVLRRPGCWLLGLSFGFYTFQWFAVATWLPSFAESEMGVTVAEAGLLAAAVVAVNILGCIGGSVVLHHGVPRWMILAGINGMMGLLALGIFDAELSGTLRIAMALVFSGFGGMLPASVLAGAPVHAPNPRSIGAANGLVIQGSNTGALISPPVIAMVVSATGSWADAAWALTLSGALGVGAALLLRVIERRLATESAN